MKPRSRIWWYLRLRRAYKLHGVTSESHRATWDAAKISQRQMPAERQHQLKKLTGPKA